MKIGFRSIAPLLLAAALQAPGVTPAAAEYPERPIRVIYPYAPGGAGDALARFFAANVTPVLGQQVVIENRAGAGGNIGVQAAAQAQPDGYTLLSVSPAFTVNFSLYTTPGFDPIKDFVPVVPLSVVPNALSVNASSPFKTAKDLVNYAKANPGKLSFGSSGIGTSVHLAAEMLKKDAQFDAVHVPYTGAGQADVDLLAGRIDFLFNSAPSVLQNVLAGKSRSLGIAATQRMKGLPDVPTLTEQGYPNVISGAWTGIVAPARTPRAVVERLHEAFTKVTRDPVAIEFLSSKLGGEPSYGTPEEFSAFIKADLDRNTALVKSLGLKVE